MTKERFNPDQPEAADNERQRDYPTPDAPETAKLTDDIVRGGVNFHF